jgi:hypothetical protein
LLEYETLDGSPIKEIVQHGRLINPPPSRVPPPGKKMSAENPLGSLGLTAREMEVLAWIAQGKTNYEIGVIPQRMYRDHLQARRTHLEKTLRRKSYRRRCHRPCGIGQRKKLSDPVR